MIFKALTDAVKYLFGIDCFSRSRYEWEERQNLNDSINDTEKSPLMNENPEQDNPEQDGYCEIIYKKTTGFLSSLYASAMFAITAGNMFNLSSMSIDAMRHEIKPPAHDTGDFVPSSLNFFTTMCNASVAKNLLIVPSFIVLIFLTIAGMAPFNAFDAKPFAQGFFDLFRKIIQRLTNPKKLADYFVHLCKNPAAILKLMFDTADLAIKYTLALSAGTVIGAFTSGTCNTAINLFAALSGTEEFIENPLWLNWMCVPIGLVVGGIPIANAIEFFFGSQVGTAFHVLMRLRNFKTLKLLRNGENSGTNNDWITNQRLLMILSDCNLKLLSAHRGELLALNIKPDQPPAEIIAKITHLKQPGWQHLLTTILLPLVGIAPVYFGTEQFYDIGMFFGGGLFKGNESLTKTAATLCQVSMASLWFLLINSAYPKLIKTFNWSVHNRTVRGKSETTVKSFLFDFVAFISSLAVSITNFAMLDWEKPFYKLAPTIAAFIPLNTIFSFYGLVSNSKRFGLLESMYLDKLQFMIGDMLNEAKNGSYEQNGGTFREINDALIDYAKKIVSIKAMKVLLSEEGKNKEIIRNVFVFFSQCEVEKTTIEEVVVRYPKDPNEITEESEDDNETEETKFDERVITKTITS